MTKDQDLKTGNWFVDLIMNLAPNPDEIQVTGTPEEMTNKAAWEAFVISTGAGMVPGPLGWATILPELTALTKLQINLVYRIAKYHNQISKLNNTIVLLILAQASGAAAGRLTLRKIGTRIIIKSLSNQSIKKLAQKIGMRISSKIVQRGLGRWIFVVTAPIFGAFSKALTTKIGDEADQLFSQDIEFERTVNCSSGHEVLYGSKFCPECGEKIEEQKDE